VGRKGVKKKKSLRPTCVFGHVPKKGGIRQNPEAVEKGEREGGLLVARLITWWSEEKGKKAGLAALRLVLEERKKKEKEEECPA